MKPCDFTEVIYHIIYVETMKQKHNEGHFQHKTVYDDYQIMTGTVSPEEFKERGALYGPSCLGSRGKAQVRI